MNLFRFVPPAFFNCLASGSNQNIYADCLQLIYREYDREISYRIPRVRIRNVLSLYFLENSVQLSDEEGVCRSANDMAAAVLRKFLSKDVGWLEEEADDTTYEKQIVMTESGIALAELLERLEKPEKQEFSSFIFNIYNTLKSDAQWRDNPYVNGIKNVNKNAKALSKSLKMLSTFIRKIIERMVKEETLESLTENILEYCEGDFIKEYARLNKQQNIHNYRMYIKSRLDEIVADEDIFARILKDCEKEEEIEEEEAEALVWDMINSTKRFLLDDYEALMRDIRHKINLYLQIAIGRARFIRNREIDVRGSVDKVLRCMVEELEEIGMREYLPEDMGSFFAMDQYLYVDERSIRYPRKNQAISQAASIELEAMTDEHIAAARETQRREAFNPYSKDLMKRYLEMNLGNKKSVMAEELPLNTKNDMLAALSAVTYAKENGFAVETTEGYFENEKMIIRDFVIRREDEL